MNFFPAFVPPSSGGELRYFNMYARLSAFFDITLLSPTYADHEFEIVTHSDTFREYRIPKEESIHHKLHYKLHDERVCAEVSALACALSSSYPNDYHKYYFELHDRADIIVHEFPYMVEYDLLWGFDDKPRVYNSHNVEHSLLKQLYHGEKSDMYLEYIFGLERKATTESDLVFATSSEEKRSFIDLYGAKEDKIALAPNGIDPQEAVPVEKRDRKSALFIGSQHPPNAEAVAFIIQEVAPKCPGIDFLIAGSCGDSFRNRPLDKNVRLLGKIDDNTKRDLLASAAIALAPMFLGAGTNLKTLEYLSFGIPLVSTDVGMRGLDFQDGEHFIRADRKDFADKVQKLIADKGLRERISQAGRRQVTQNYSWEGIANSVKEEIDRLPLGRRTSKKRILLLNDFRASNPTGGGEVRISHLYSALSRQYDVLLFCLNNSAQITKAQITQTFTEISFPKTLEHAAEEKRINNMFWVSASDIVSSYMCARNPFFMAALRAFYGSADLVVLEHPYMLPALKDMDEKPLIYESHNFEYGLKKTILKNHPLFDTLIRHVEDVEKAACRRSSLVLSVSSENIEQLIRFTGIDGNRAHLIRNGVDVKYEGFFSDAYEGVKELFRGKPPIIFIGSSHSPNIKALHFIINSLAPALPHCCFLIVGTVCNAFNVKDMPKNVLLFGRLSDEYKEVLLRIADVAINPMFEGSGSNLKLAEYLAYKLVTITTKMGARGYEVEDGKEAVICELPEFARKIAQLLTDDATRFRLSENGYSYACAKLDWVTLAEEYSSILENTFFAGGKKKLLVVTYRFTYPPLGGAEVFLLNVLREVDKLGDFAITVCTLDIHDICNKFHFSSEYTYDSGIPSVHGMNDTSVYKFKCDRVTDDDKLRNARNLFARWMDESVLCSLRQVEKYTFPMLMGGWHFPENSGGHYEVWSGDTAVIYVAGIEEIEIAGYRPFRDKLSLSTDMKNLEAKTVDGNFRIGIKTESCRWVQLKISPFSVPEDPRPLGVRISEIKYRMNGEWRDLGLNYNYREYLKEKNLPEYIEELIRIAESRPSEYDDLFQYTRGPVSKELENWLDRNVGRFDVVLGHSIPFSTSILATRYAKKYGKPVMILPHFHMDDEFYHWKSYYDALRSAEVVLASPLSSIDLFFSKIGTKAKYLPGGIDPQEFADIGASDFRSTYNSDLPFFLVLGRKAGAKNYRWAIDAVRKVNAKKRLCNLVIIGRDEDGERIDESDAIYLGERERNTVLGALKECSALVNMSESESFGIVILEAWMQKKPVIVNKKCSAFVELVSDSVNGLLAGRDNLADRMRFILDESDRVRQMGEKGFEKVQKEYTWQVIGKTANEVALGLLLAPPTQSKNGKSISTVVDDGQQVLSEGDFEALLQRAYQAVLREGDIAIDVGAHVGRHCIPMANSVSPSGKVFAVEPLPVCRGYLTHQIEVFHKELKDIIKIYPFAMSDYEGKGEFVVAKDALAYSGLRERIYDVPTELEKIPVTIKTIDNLFLDLPSLRYIKIDAEGGEYHIMRGAAACIDKFRPLVSFEFGVNSIKEYGFTPDEPAQFLLDRGYRIYDILGRLLPAPSDFVQSATSQNVWDYIAVPAENKTLERTILGILTVGGKADDPSEKRVVSRLLLNSDDAIEKIMSLHKRCIPHEEDFLLFKNLPPGDGIFLDVGANAGQSAVSFRCIDKNRRIVSFEPNYLFEPVLQYVKDHLLEYFDFSLCGLGNKKETLTLIVPYVDGAPYFQECSVDRSQFEKSWVKERLKKYGADLSFREMDIQIVAADDLNLKPDIIKIDAEGFELSVLEGMKKTIVSQHPVFLIENNDYERVTAFLIALGYDVFSYAAGENRLQAVGVSTNSFYLHKIYHASLIKKLSDK